MFRTPVIIFAQLSLALLTVIPNLTQAQVKHRISIATGGTGGVYHPLGGGMAALISKNIPNTEATAEVTTASVDNENCCTATVSARLSRCLTPPGTASAAGHQGIARQRRILEL